MAFIFAMNALTYLKKSLMMNYVQILLKLQVNYQNQWNATAKDTPRMALAPNFDFVGVPSNAIILPLEKYLLMNSAVFLQATQSIQSVWRLPSLENLSTARVKLQTGVPFWVVLCSGAAARRPWRATILSMGISSL